MSRSDWLIRCMTPNQSKTRRAIAITTFNFQRLRNSLVLLRQGSLEMIPPPPPQGCIFMSIGGRFCVLGSGTLFAVRAGPCLRERGTCPLHSFFALCLRENGRRFHFPTWLKKAAGSHRNNGLLDQVKGTDNGLQLLCSFGAAEFGERLSAGLQRSFTHDNPSFVGNLTEQVNHLFCFHSTNKSNVRYFARDRKLNRFYYGKKNHKMLQVHSDTLILYINITTE